MKAKSLIWGPIESTAFHTEDGRHWPALSGLLSLLNTNTREPWPANVTKVPLKAYTGSRASHKNQIHDFWARHKVEYNSVLSQQSISGKIISLTLCVWKPGIFSNPITKLYQTYQWLLSRTELLRVYPSI